MASFVRLYLEAPLSLAGPPLLRSLNLHPSTADPRCNSDWINRIPIHALTGMVFFSLQFSRQKHIGAGIVPTLTPFSSSLLCRFARASRPFLLRYDRYYRRRG